MFRMIMALIAIIFGIKLLNDDENNNIDVYNLSFDEDCNFDLDDDTASDDESWL